MEDWANFIITQLCVFCIVTPQVKTTHKEELLLQQKMQVSKTTTNQKHRAISYPYGSIEITWCVYDFIKTFISS